MAVGNFCVKLGHVTQQEVGVYLKTFLIKVGAISFKLIGQTCNFGK